MYSKYINNIRLREEPREPIVGGVSLPMFQNLASEVLGGGGSLNKISHLSVPVGLVISTPMPKTSYMMPHQTKPVHASENDDTIDEHLFNKLYNQTAYQTKNSKKRTTRRKHRS